MPGAHGKNYYDTIGKKYGYLTIVEPLPRERDQQGHLKPAIAIVKCGICGSVTKQKITVVIGGLKKSCGCIDYNSKRCTDLKNRAKWLQKARDLEVEKYELMYGQEEGVPYIVEKLQAKYYCVCPDDACMRNSAAHLCCCECDKRNRCGLACHNRPDKCGAKKREVEQID